MDIEKYEKVLVTNKSLNQSKFLISYNILSDLKRQIGMSPLVSKWVSDFVNYNYVVFFAQLFLNK